MLEHIRQDLENYLIDADAEETKKRRQPKVQDIVILNEQLRRLNVIFMAGNISDEEYAAETSKLKSEIQKAKAAEEDGSPANLQALRNLLKSDFLSKYDTLLKEDRRRLWRSLIEEIYIDGTNVTGIKPRF